MKNILPLSLLLLSGCFGGPDYEPGHRLEKTPAAATLAGESRPEGGIEAMNRRNAERLREGDWRAVKPAVGPESP